MIVNRRHNTVMRHIQVAIGVLRSQGFWALFRSIILWLRGIRRYSGSYTKAAYRAHLQYSESKLMQLASQKALAKTWQKCPYLTLVTSVDDNSIQAFQETYLSLSSQSYDSWEWIIVTSLVDFERLTPVGAMIANDSRIKMFEGLSAPNNPVPLLNKGLQNISGDFFIFIEAGDTLAPFALF